MCYNFSVSLFVHLFVRIFALVLFQCFLALTSVGGGKNFKIKYEINVSEIHIGVLCAESINTTTLIKTHP
jgi:hypothetical protein